MTLGVIAVAAAIVVGFAIAFQVYYIAQVNDHVNQLQAKVCHYQQQAVRIATALAEAGHPLPPGTLPPAESCPPP
jgi:hypothetical protein